MKRCCLFRVSFGFLIACMGVPAMAQTSHQWQTTYSNPSLPSNSSTPRLFWRYSTSNPFLRIGVFSSIQNSSSANGSFSVGIGTDPSVTGSYAFAMTNTKYHPYYGIIATALASGASSFAFGSAPIAQGSHSFVFGEPFFPYGNTYIETSSSSSASHAFVFGHGARANNAHAFSFGFNTLASGAHSLAFGNAASAYATGSMAFGDGSTASGAYGTAIGWQSSASGVGSLAAGGGVTVAQGDWSIAAGYGTKTAKYGADPVHGEPSQINFAFGWNVESKGTSSFVIGQNNLRDSSVFPWDPTSPSRALFVIGNGPSPGDLRNAFIVKANGDVIISKAQGDISMGEFTN